MVRVLLHEDGLVGMRAGDVVEMTQDEAKFWLANDRGEPAPTSAPVSEALEPEPVIETAEVAPPRTAAKRTTKPTPRRRPTTRG